MLQKTDQKHEMMYERNIAAIYCMVYYSIQKLVTVQQMSLDWKKQWTFSGTKSGKHFWVLRPEVGKGKPVGLIQPYNSHASPWHVMITWKYIQVICFLHFLTWLILVPRLNFVVYDNTFSYLKCWFYHSQTSSSWHNQQHIYKMWYKYVWIPCDIDYLTSLTVL
jgi:hypothetical protein